MENTHKTELLMREGNSMIELVDRGALLAALSNSPNFSGSQLVITLMVLETNTRLVLKL